MKAVAHIARLYRDGLTTLAALTMLAIVVIMGVQVFYRYVLNDSLIWAEEVCRYLLVWSTFLFAGLAFSRGEMVAIEAVTLKLPPVMRCVVIAAGAAAVVVFLLVLARYGWTYAEFNRRQSIPAADFIWSDISGSRGAAHLSVFWIYVCVPVGACLLAAHVALDSVARVRAVLAGPDTAPVYPGNHDTGRS